MPKSNNKTKKSGSSVAAKATALPAKAAPARKVSAAPVKEKAKTTKPPEAAPPQAKGGRASFKKEITKKLHEARARILQEVSHKMRQESDNLKFEIGDIYDIASSERERELALMLGDRDREKLAEIDEALERIKDNTYGVCEECGEAIAENRLIALPFTRVCVECQSKNEKEQKIRGKMYEEETGLGIMERSEEEEEF